MDVFRDEGAETGGRRGGGGGGEGLFSAENGAPSESVNTV